MFTNPRISESHANLLADDRAGADYLNQEAILGQIVCVDSYIVAIFYKFLPYHRQ